MNRVNLSLAAIVCVPFGWYVFSVFYEIHKIRRVCEEVKVGDTFLSAKAKAQSYGVAREMVTAPNGIRQADEKLHWFIPAHLSMGETLCVVVHDGEYVTATHMSEPPSK